MAMAVRFVFMEEQSALQEDQEALVSAAETVEVAAQLISPAGRSRRWAENTQQGSAAGIVADRSDLQAN